MRDLDGERFETGQFSAAVAAAVSNAAASRPGTRPSTSRWLPVMPWPAWKPTVAVTRSSSGGVPAWASPWASAMQ